MAVESSRIDNWPVAATSGQRRAKPGRLLQALGLGLVVLLSGCGTDARGVGACRAIETARCTAAKSCGLLEDVGQCQRFARDNCLHGTALEEDPSTVDVNRCVEAIELAGECADRRGAKTDPENCSTELFANTDANEICEVVLEPERTPRCSFLVPDEEPEPKLDEKMDGGN